MSDGDGEQELMPVIHSDTAPEQKGDEAAADEKASGSPSVVVDEASSFARRGTRARRGSSISYQQKVHQVPTVFESNTAKDLIDAVKSGGSQSGNGALALREVRRLLVALEFLVQKKVQPMLKMAASPSELESPMSPQEEKVTVWLLTLLELPSRCRLGCRARSAPSMARCAVRELVKGRSPSPP